MDSKKRAQLEANGWVVTSVEEFLGLTPEEVAYIDLKLRLARDLKRRRVEKQFTQTALADLIGSSQSRVAKMENGDPSVSIDLMIRALLFLGVTPSDLARIIDSFEPPEQSKSTLTGASTAEAIHISKPVDA